MARIEAKLAEMKIELNAPQPAANYVPFVQSGRLLFVSGQACSARDGSLITRGKLGENVSVADGVAGARQCAINILAIAKLALGDLDRIARVVRLGGFVNSSPDFTDGPLVLNGASDLMVAVFGERGRHARTTVGAASLPGSTAVEVDAVFEII